MVEITDDLYRDSEGKLYTDVTLETPFNATIGETLVQAEALAENTTTIGDVEYVIMTASTYEVETAEGNGIVLNPEKVICELEDGVPTTTNNSVIDVTPEPADTDSDSDTDTDTDSDSDSDTDTDSDSDTDTDSDTDSDTDNDTPASDAQE